MNKNLTVILPIQKFDQEVKELLPLSLKSVDKDIEILLVTSEEVGKEIKTEFKNAEIVVVNDSSKDKTKEIVEKNNVVCISQLFNWEATI